MESPKTAKNLKLALVGLDPPIVISDFDNYSGTLSSSVAEPGLREGAILTSDGKALWGGIVRINDDRTFDLCVSPAANAAKDEVIPWKDLPPFFTVFDGGYESLSQESVNTLLDDLITFNDLVKVRCHFELNGKQESVSGKWGDQENLKTLSEILIDWNFSQKLVPEQLVLLEVELFETVYFVIAIHEESDHEGIVLSLTSHFYQQRNRIGRRIPIDPIEIDGLKILEVSDFGMKVSSQATRAVGAEELRVTINGFQLLFGVTYKKKVSLEETQMGLFIQDHSPEARKAWQGFLLNHQYPLLSYRTQDRHADLFNLYDTTGYTDQEMKLIFDAAKKEICNEWNDVDTVGPFLGGTVMGYHNSLPVASIGVSRASGGLWMAQAAAVINKPEFLKYTRSMYSWRTRFILQQIDGSIHLAFFLKNKPFLNRFFRKFYLIKSKSEQCPIIWEEWFHYAAVRSINSGRILTMPEEHAREVEINKSTYRNSKLTAILSQNGCPVESKENSILIKGRSYAHVDQYLNSIIINGDSDLSPALDAFKDVSVFIALSQGELTTDQLNFLLERNYDVSGGYEEISWACPRFLLPEFLQNSLRALEHMTRKYSKAA
ncbi:MAG: hypothetical protein JST80_11495 [Bdellovibrionales bacterium]|nr:hypothetical protein [Bdellovibrionales bacterium]